MDFFFICKFETIKRFSLWGFFGWLWSLLHTFKDVLQRQNKLSGILTKNAWEMSGQSHPGCCGSLRCVHCTQKLYLDIQYQWETPYMVHLLALSWTLAFLCSIFRQNTNASHKVGINVFTKAGVVSLNDLFLHAVP